MLRVFCLALLATLTPFSLHAEDWPGWRGPTRQGLSSETDVPTKWSATENVAWKADIPGFGWSSPIVVGDRVIVTTATEEGVSCRLLCLNAKTGKLVWDKEVFRQKPGDKQESNSYATPTPVSDGERVYVVFAGGGLAALSMKGEVIWTNQEYSFHSVHGCGASPILHENLLIFPFDITSDGPNQALGHTEPWEKSFILALDKKTGKEKWKARRGLSRVGHATPQVFADKEKVLLISAAGDVVQGHDIKTGNKVWSLESPKGEGVVPSVVLGGGMIFTASGFGEPTICAFTMKGDGKIKPKMGWTSKKAVPMVPSFLFAKDHLFTVSDDGIALCLKPAGGDVIWRERIRGKHFASPVYADSKIYFLNEEGESTVIEAGLKFKVLARNSIKESCRASMAISNKKLFIRSQGHLFCIGRDKKEK